MGRIYDMSEAQFNAVGRSEARQVASHQLLGVEEGGRTRLAITRIEPGGSFGPHVDDYGHVICVLEGHGELKVGGRRTPAGPGTVMVTKPASRTACSPGTSRSCSWPPTSTAKPDLCAGLRRRASPGQAGYVGVLPTAWRGA